MAVIEEPSAGRLAQRGGTVILEVPRAEAAAIDGADTTAYQPIIATNPATSSAQVARRQAGRHLPSTTGTAASSAR